MKEDPVCGYIVKNSFLCNSKIDEQVAMFSSAAARLGANLTVVGNAELVPMFGKGFSFSVGLPGFAMFYDKDIALAYALERAGVRLFNRAKAIALCDDKALTHAALAAAGIPCPETFAMPMTYGLGCGARYASSLAPRLGFPLVAKERRGSQGAQVALIPDARALSDYLEATASRELIFQRFVPSEFDVRLNVVGKDVVACIKRFGMDGALIKNAALGGRCEAYEPSDMEKLLALKCAKVLGLEFAGVDMLVSGEPLVLEVNSNPQTMATQRATGVDVSELIVRRVLSRVEGARTAGRNGE